MKNRIRELREAKGWTLNGLARLIGIRRETLYLIEQGRFNPSSRILRRLTKALGCNFDDLGIDFSEDPQEQEFLERLKHKEEYVYDRRLSRNKISYQNK